MVPEVGMVIIQKCVNDYYEEYGYDYELDGMEGEILWVRRRDTVRGPIYDFSVEYEKEIRHITHGNPMGLLDTWNKNACCRNYYDLREEKFEEIFEIKNLTKLSLIETSPEYEGIFE